MPTPGGQEFTEQPIKSPELVLEGMRTDRMSGNAGSFLAGVLELDQLKATKEYATEIQKLGHERSIWRQVSDGLKEADLEGDKKSVSAYLRLGGLLGINEDPELAMQLDEMRGIYSLPTLPKEAEEDARNADVEALVKVFGRNDSGVLVLPEEAVEEIKPGRKLTSKEKTQLNEDIKYYLGIDRMRKEMPDKPDELQSLQEAYLAVVDKFKENIDQRFNKSGEKKQVLNYEIANAVNAVNAEYDYDPEIDGYDLIAGVTRKLQEALEEDTDLSNEVLLRVSKTKIFGGQKLNDFVNSNAIKRIGNYLWGHKGEIFVGGAAGFAAKSAARTALASAGGVALVAAGFLGGGVTGGVKEYIKQRKGIEVEDAGKTLLISGLKTEFRKMKASDKKAIAWASGKGAVFGAVGAVIGVGFAEIIANNEAAQGLVSAAQEKISGAGQFVHEQLGNLGRSGVDVMGEPVPGSGALTYEHAPGFEAPAADTGVPEISETPSLEPITPPVTEAAPLLPHSTDVRVLPSGSNPWHEMEAYLKENFNGRDPSPQEVQEAVTRVLAENNIHDATKIPAGFNLKLSSVNEYLKSTIGGEPSFPERLSILPEKVSLPSGSNPWNETNNYLHNALGHEPSNAEIMEITKEVCKQSNISVTSWGIPGEINDRQIPIGYNLIFDDEVKKKIAGLLIKK